MSKPEFRSGFRPQPQVSHVIFDFDGTLSWLRHGWPEIMGRLFREVLPLRPRESEAAIRELLLNEILSLNGKSTIFQMRRCAELVAERWGKPLSPEDLLLEYQRRLDAAIAERTAEIRAEHAQRDDFVVYGGRRFIKQLAGRGLGLIILSGTVEARVKQEAGILDLARYFGSHIYGSTDDLAQSDKKTILRRLMTEESISGECVLAFGDGPVEIELAKAVGGWAVGVASDEEVNGSGKLHPQKHVQLREAGADVLIPDYRDPETLIESLLGR
jgi:phosphoglycolate phosphatase